MIVSTGPGRLSPFSSQVVIKNSLPGRESEQVLAAAPAKPALENWFGINTCGPEHSFSMHWGGTHAQKSLASLDRSRCVMRGCLSGVHREVKDDLLMS